MSIRNRHIRDRHIRNHRMTLHMQGLAHRHGHMPGQLLEQGQLQGQLHSTEFAVTLCSNLGLVCPIIQIPVERVRYHRCHPLQVCQAEACLTASAVADSSRQSAATSFDGSLPADGWYAGAAACRSVARYASGAYAGAAAADVALSGDDAGAAAGATAGAAAAGLPASYSSSPPTMAWSLLAVHVSAMAPVLSAVTGNTAIAAARGPPASVVDIFKSPKA